MSRKKHKKNVQILLSPEKYIRSRCRSIPFGECYINNDWREDGLAQVFIARKHSNDNLTVGIYLVDVFCLGVKDTFYRFNISTIEYDDFIENVSKDVNLVPVDYLLAHNIIYGAIGFAEDFGFSPHKEFTKTTQFVLEEDDEDVELIDLEFGKNGKPFLIVQDENESYKGYLRILEETAGHGNFEYLLHDGDSSDSFTVDDSSNGHEDLFLIRYYDDKDFEKKIFHELDQLSTYSDEERENIFNDKEFLLETYYRMAELSLASFFSKEEKQEAYEFGESLFDIDFYDNDDLAGNIGITDLNDLKTFSIIFEFLAENKPKKAIKNLKRLMESYPEEPTFHFYMILALLLDNKDRKADDLAIYAYQKYPDNLMIVTQYLSYLIRSKRFEKINEIIGETFFLQEIYPDTKFFHEGVALTYYKTIFRFLLETNQLLKARAVFFQLDKLGTPDEEVDFYHELFIEGVTRFFEDKEN